MKKILLFLLVTFHALSQTNRGNLRFIIDEPNNPKYTVYYDELYNKRCVVFLAEYMNATFNFQRDIVVTFTENESVDNAESHGNGEIFFSYKYLDFLYSNSPDFSTNKVANACCITILHELGHELVSQFNLQGSFSGKEENFVDEFALMHLLKFSNDSRMSDAAFVGVLNKFNGFLRTKKYNIAVDFSDEHSPDLERYYDDLLSILYSKTKDDYLVSDNEEVYLPTRRAKRSVNTYESKKIFWENTLSQFKKNDKVSVKKQTSSKIPKTDDGW